MQTTPIYEYHTFSVCVTRFLPDIPRPHIFYMLQYCFFLIFFKCESTVTNAQLVILRTAVICCFPSFLVQGRNEYEYDRWSQYKAFYNTPDADREYVLYWEKMVKEMKVFMVQ